MPKSKNEAAAALGRKRWEGVSKAERSRLAKAAINARWAKRTKPSPKSAKSSA